RVGGVHGEANLRSAFQAIDARLLAVAVVRMTSTASVASVPMRTQTKESRCAHASRRRASLNARATFRGFTPRRNCHCWLPMRFTRVGARLVRHILVLSRRFSSVISVAANPKQHPDD